MEKLSNQYRQSAPPQSADIAQHLVIVGEPFTRNELQALRLRGLLREVLPGAYLPGSIADEGATRAKVAAGVAGSYLNEDSALCKRTAAWIYGCAPSPTEIEIVVPRYHRPCPPTSRMILRMSEGPTGEEHISRLGGVKVTSPLRTALDIAFSSQLEQAAQILEAIDASAKLNCSFTKIEHQIALAARRPGRIRALALVRRLIAEKPAHQDREDVRGYERRCPPVVR
ncbi:hypothetical protein CQ018_09070 [Arthrobacter sp. MYb227]|uniref:type IV toxin-antitoxin system AbiEi family antitoxin n=1 Tax=Arthrobacter sp. MYb227 TaxID=1848601 RepID=UPI000CFAA14F|nr:type IV toxin-antitoxin system AbiEi family antitoxin [Arthrobacter sp. MYb227]PQZ93790.1 hypothetical protein CQ018_09070 [Arthrobacter sp. MYb227]